MNDQEPACTDSSLHCPRCGTCRCRCAKCKQDWIICLCDLFDQLNREPCDSCPLHGKNSDHALAFDVLDSLDEPRRLEELRKHGISFTGGATTGHGLRFTGSASGHGAVFTGKKTP